MVTVPAGRFWSFCFWAAVLGVMTLNPVATSMLSLFCVVCVLAQLIIRAVHPGATMLRKRRVVDFIEVKCSLTESRWLLQSRGEKGQKQNRLFPFLSSWVPDSPFCFSSMLLK